MRSAASCLACALTDAGLSFAAALYQTIKSHQSAMDTLYKRNQELKEELQELTNLLDDLAKTYNPNYQDMAVKGAVMAYRTWKRDGSEEGSEEDSGDGSKIASEPPLRLNRLKEEGEWSREKVEALVRKDALELLDAIEVTGKSNESGLRELLSVRDQTGHADISFHDRSLPHP